MVDPSTGQTQLTELGQALMNSPQYQPNSGGLGVIAQLLQAFMGAKMKQPGDVTKNMPAGTTPLTDGMNPEDY